MAKLHLEVTVNGQRRTAEVYPMARLLDVLREDLGLTGTKEGCGEGECGACSVILDGRLVNSCLVPAVQAQGADIRTIEGVARDGRLGPVQRAFLACNGAQCGFCTPGMVLAAEDLLGRCPHPDEAEVRAGLAGNLCRCTGYVKIVDAVLEAGAVDAETELGSGSAWGSRVPRYPGTPASPDGGTERATRAEGSPCPAEEQP